MADEELIAFLLAKDISAVELSVVSRPFQKHVTERCTDFTPMLSSTIVIRLSQHLQINEQIETSFTFEMV